jgi:ABC-type antimicrobial peptide transport system permease subunit
VISYIVAQRTTEIGVRLALGADAAEVRRMILMQGMRLTAVGVVVGLLVAVAMGRLMTSLLYGVSPFDVTTFVVGAATFLVVAALAGIIPAVRASRIPPAVALQSG